MHHISEYSFNEIIDVNKIGQILKQNIAISEIVPRIVFQMHQCIRERIIRDFSNNNEKKNYDVNTCFMKCFSFFFIIWFVVFNLLPYASAQQNIFCPKHAERRQCWCCILLPIFASSLGICPCFTTNGIPESTERTYLWLLDTKKFCLLWRGGLTSSALYENKPNILILLACFTLFSL